MARVLCLKFIYVLSHFQMELEEAIRRSRIVETEEGEKEREIRVWLGINSCEGNRIGSMLPSHFSLLTLSIQGPQLKSPHYWIRKKTFQPLPDLLTDHLT